MIFHVFGRFWGPMDLLILWMHRCYEWMHAFMDALRYGFMDAFMDAFMLWIYGCIYGCIALWFWSIFMMLWHSYKQLHWRNAHCLCMGSSAYGQLFKVNMQQLIRRYASQFASFSTDSGGLFFPSPVEVLPYRRDDIAVIVRWVGYSDWASVCGFHALPFSTLRLDRVPATISYPQKSILHPYTWSNANGQSPGSTWTNAPPFRSFPKPCKVVIFPFCLS